MPRGCEPRGWAYRARRDTLTAIAAADVLRHPCPVEIFGNVLAEAMALGTPIVAMRAAVTWRCWAPMEARQSSWTTTCRIIRQWIAELCANAERGRALAAAARTRARSQVFPLARMIDAYEEMMQSLVGKAPSSRMTTHLLLTSNFPPLYDGIASWMSQLARHYGDDAMLVSLGSEPGQEASDARQCVRVDRMPIPRARLRNLPGIIAWSRRAASLAREHDVSFTWCGNLKPPSYVAWTLRARMGIPYGVILHGTELLQMRQYGSGLRKRIVARTLLGRPR